MFARTMLELADILVDDFDVVDVLFTLTQRCVEVLDINAAGIMLADTNDQPRLMISSDETLRVLDVLEIHSREGPCLESFRTGVAVVDQDLTTCGDRWPRFAAAALAAGYRSADAIPMQLRGRVIGALNLFRSEDRSLGARRTANARALAHIATIAVLQNRTAVEAPMFDTQLAMALSSRVAIEHARGVIAERQQVSLDQAFGQLRRYARDNNLRLVDLARATILGDVDPADINPGGADPSSL